MKEIEWLVDNIDEELSDACKYIDKAFAEKDKHPDWANSFYQLSQQEMAHADVLHGMAVGLIKAYTGEVPAGMEWVWKREHEKYIEKAAKIKMKHEMYRK